MDRSPTDSPHLENDLFGNQHVLLLPREQSTLVGKKLKLFIFQDFSLLSWWCVLKVVGVPGNQK